MEYSNAFIAYIDILGFKGIIKQYNPEYMLNIYELIDKKINTIYKEDTAHGIVPKELPTVSLVRAN